MIMNKVNNKSAKAAPVMLIIGILFIAANLRAPLTSVGPLVSLIRANFPYFSVRLTTSICRKIQYFWSCAWSSKVVHFAS